MARIKLTGDFAVLNDMVARLSNLEKVLPEISRNAAEETLSLIRDGFQKQEDPYGENWKKKAFPDGRAVLVGKTARLRNGWHVKRANRSGFLVAPSVNYAQYHQGGTGVHGPKGTRIKPKKARALRFEAGGNTIFRRSVEGAPKRKMIPDRGLPARWRDALVDTAREVIESHLEP